jgi:predicted DNA-binding protein YlxM (UPF0122 family)
MEVAFIISIILLGVSLITLITFFPTVLSIVEERKLRADLNNSDRQAIADVINSIRKDISHMEVNAKAISDDKVKDSIEQLLSLIDEEVEYIEELNQRSMNGNL